MAAMDQRVASNTHRIEGLERGQEALNRLAAAVEVLAAKQTVMDEALRRITGKLDTLERGPARRPCDYRRQHRYGQRRQRRAR